MSETVLAQGKANKIRLAELDIMRGLCVLIMVIEHTHLYLTSKSLLGNPLVHITQSGPGNVAVIFMFIMGMNTIFSRNTEPLAIFKRGVKIFIFSYVFNFFRDFLPAYIGTQIGRTTLASQSLNYLYEALLWVDILQFVGLAFMFIAILKFLKIPLKVQLGVAFLISLVTVIVGNISTTESISNYGLELLTGGWRHIYFPFVSWVVFPVCGAFFASRIKGMENRDNLYQGIIRWSFVTNLILWGFLLYYYPRLDFFGWNDSHNYYRQNTLGNVFFINLILFLIGVSYFIVKNNLIPEKAMNFLSFWSQNITSLYIISWIFISWTAWVITGFNVIENPILAILVSVLFVVLTHVTVRYVPAINKFFKVIF